MNKPRILIIGQNGQVAWELQRSLATLGELHIASRDSNTLPVDLAQPDSIHPLIQQLRPHWIINAAAYTAVDEAESEAKLAMTINGDAPTALAAAAKDVDALLVHYSTNYVFDGTAEHPYHEADATNPQSVYGRSKLAGEEGIRRSGCAHLILRTSWVYGARGHNFLRTMCRMAREYETLRIVADQFGSPTWSRNIAEATSQILVQLGTRQQDWAAATGTYHLSSTGQTSWYEFASCIIAHQRRHEHIKTLAVQPITTEEYPLPAPRPLFSVLDTRRIGEQFGLFMPHWRDALEQVLTELETSS